ncbi:MULTISPECIES: hypothetical protein [unclassified Xanthobacter]|uniref:hypothetical protein n=1 Tax=unclassified Xanthobacter TaxID=2623496 RepID=UPI001EDE1C56|nr:MULTISPECIES: hypothetical protein [unclassified Xanthobacter]
MRVIYLVFSSRAEALTELGARLGYVSSAEEVGGRERLTAGRCDGVRYDVDFLADNGRRPGSPDHVNVLWHGADAAAPDFGAYAVDPASPSCKFGGAA